jgi:hypothetical protein
MPYSRCALILAILLAPIAPAMANPPPAAKSPEGELNEKEVARSLDLYGLVFPVFTETGKLKNYIFVDAKMLVADRRDPSKYREQAHFIRDAVLRAAHRVSFNKKGDYTKLDEELASRECLKAANDVLGDSGAIATMKFMQIASQTDQPR